ncbi:MAG: hypothetical protein E6146_11020, partial [Bifidobacterium sp.]|uniref:hypothetical protein n=1 Tax=Bifidobacterium TaxID=1678 RepID=UPI002912191A
SAASISAAISYPYAASASRSVWGRSSNLIATPQSEGEASLRRMYSLQLMWYLLAVAVNRPAWTWAP